MPLNYLIIESPHMIKQALSVMEKIPDFEGDHWRSLATFGHLLDYRDKPFDLTWEPILPDIFKAFVDQLPEADCIWIATDPDDEGERIAYQVKAICDHVCPDTPVNRIRVYAWTEALVKETIADPMRNGFRLEAAYSAERRRTFDRMVALMFSAQGRIKSSLIEAWATNPPPTHFDDKRMDRIDPQDCASILIEATRHGIDIGDAYQSLCDSWAHGFCTYPRTDGTVYDRAIASLAMKIAQSEGYRANRDLSEVIGESGNHTALAAAHVSRQPGEPPIMEIIRNLTAASVSQKMISRPRAGKPMPEDARWLHLMKSHHLGRPSTYARHAGFMIDNRVVGPDGQIKTQALNEARKLPDTIRCLDHDNLAKSLKTQEPMPELFERLTGKALEANLCLNESEYRSGSVIGRWIKSLMTNKPSQALRPNPPKNKSPEL